MRARRSLQILMDREGIRSRRPKRQVRPPRTRCPWRSHHGLDRPVVDEPLGSTRAIQSRLGRARLHRPPTTPGGEFAPQIATPKKRPGTRFTNGEPGTRGRSAGVEDRANLARRGRRAAFAAATAGPLRTVRPITSVPTRRCGTAGVLRDGGPGAAGREYEPGRILRRARAQRPLGVRDSCGRGRGPALDSAAHRLRSSPMARFIDRRFGRSGGDCERCTRVRSGRPWPRTARYVWDKRSASRGRGGRKEGESEGETWNDGSPSIERGRSSPFCTRIAA